MPDTKQTRWSILSTTRCPSASATYSSFDGDDRFSSRCVMPATERVYMSFNTVSSPPPCTHILSRYS